MSQTLIQLNHLEIKTFYSIPFDNTCVNSFNISSLCSSVMIISSTFLEFATGTGFGFTTLSAILFPINSPVALAALWTDFLKVVFKASLVLFL